MDVFNLINKVSTKMTNYFISKEKYPKKFYDNIIEINNKILLWIKDTNFTISEFINYITTLTYMLFLN